MWTHVDLEDGNCKISILLSQLKELSCKNPQPEEGVD